VYKSKIIALLELTLLNENPKDCIFLGKSRGTTPEQKSVIKVQNRRWHAFYSPWHCI